MAFRQLSVPVKRWMGNYCSCIDR